MIRTADIYLRLSNEELRVGESGSITNQRNIIKRYCDDNDIVIASEFVDDGYSGSNFDRPGFQAMLSHLRNSKVDMVITKDLSRLGRDMSESSYYAETYFPENRVRYIAISDNFDSDETNTLAPLQFAMNDVYLRDCSKKIKTVLNNKKRNGEYCACPPFGYMKAQGRKGVLTPDPNTAPIVQEIFELAYSGMSAYAIAKLLTEQNRITPLKYRVMYRDDFSEKGAAKASDYWNYVTVKRIIQNEVYLGNAVQGKTKKASVKSRKKIPIPKDEWLISEGTHTPLVSQEMFDKAQIYMKAHTKSYRDNPDMRKSVFRGLVFCPYCGSAMCSGGTVYKEERNRYWYLVCDKASEKHGVKCSVGARIKYETLLSIVKNDLNDVLASFSKDIDFNSIAQRAVQVSSDNQKYKDSAKEERALRKRLDDIKKIISKLYSDNINGVIDDDTLSGMVSSLTTEASGIKTRIEEIQNIDERVTNFAKGAEQFKKLAEQYTHIDELTPEILHTFISRIEVYKREQADGIAQNNSDATETQKVKIFYNFIGNISS